MLPCPEQCTLLTALREARAREAKLREALAVIAKMPRDAVSLCFVDIASAALKEVGE